MEFLLPRISQLTETQYRLFMFAQAIVVRHAKGIIPSPLDADVADGVASVAATLETAGKGIIYEHRATSIPAQRIAAEISSAIGDLAKRAGADAARLERDSARALRALEQTARDARQAMTDSVRPEVSWVTFASRIMADAEAAPNDTRAEAESRLVI